MLLELFPFDIFNFISGIFILVFVIVIIFFIIVILIVYKLLHTNVYNVKKKAVKVIEAPIENSVSVSKEKEKEELITVKDVSVCKYCGENVEENVTFCPFCGSNLTS